MDKNTNLINQIHKCLLPKLSKGIDETENPIEYEIRLKNLRDNLDKLNILLNDIDLRECPVSSTILSNIIILYEEIKSTGNWNTEECKEYIKPLDKSFEILYGFPLNQILYINIFDKKDIFNVCIKILHEKITVDSLKKYPSLVEVYSSLVEKVKEYDVDVNPSTVLPLSLILMDDYLESNKLKGLRCCSATLRCLTTEHFMQGNYYEVIYCSLKKLTTEKNIEITKLIFECLLQLLQVLPSDPQYLKLEDVYAVILDELYITSNLYRKAECFKFTKCIIQMHGVNCVSRKMFLSIIIDNLDACTNDAVADILLSETLECLETWIRYCWCIWKLSSDHKVLSILFKVLYTCKEKCLLSKIQNLIQTLISLCNVEDQKKIRNSLEISPEMTNPDFIEAVQSIKNKIVV